MFFFSILPDWDFYGGDLIHFLGGFSFLFFSFLFFSFLFPGAAAYCVCKDGLSDQVLQKSLDYACGAGADCSAILQNGACYNPNTVKSHCDYAVNSYFQKKGQATGSCDFAGTATQTQNNPCKFLGKIF